MTNTDPNEWRLIDADLVTEQGILPAGQRHLYFQLNEPGSGQLSIPLGSNLAASVASGMFARGSYRGAVRGGFFIENINKIHADAREGAGKMLSISGRGPLALLDDAVVWDDGTNASTREFAAMTKAAMLIAMIDEAQARGALANLTYDFTAVLDSDGQAWSDSETLKFAVGMSLLDVARQFARLGIDFDVVPDVGGTFLLNAYKLGKGSDKSATVYFRVGLNCEEVSSDERGDGIRNALRVAYRDGFISVSDAISIAARRRREKLLDVKAAQTSESALTIGAAEVELSKDPKKSISVKIYDGVGPRAFVDYDLGDTITLDVEGTETAYRIRGIQPSWDGDNYADVVVDLNSTIYENDIRMAQDIGWLMDQWETAHDMGLLETSFWAAIGDPSISYTITALHFVGTKLFVVSTGGNFYSYETTTGVWTAILPAGAAAALCLTSIGTDIYFGCSGVVYKYDSVGGTLTNIGVISGGGGAEIVYAITAIGTTVYISGDFTDVDGVAAMNRAEYNTLTDTWTAMVGGVAFTGEVSLVGIGSVLYSGGNGTVQKWTAGAWSDVGAFPGTGNVFALAAYGTSLLAGADNIYIWDGAAWAVFGGGVNGAVKGIAVYLTDVYIIGNFTDVGNYIAKYSGGVWNTLEGGLNATGTDIALLDQDVYVGGTFTAVGSDLKPALKLAAYFTNFEALLEYLENSGMFNLAEAIHNAPASALSDADEVPFWEDVSKAVRKITWANIKVALNALYVSLTQTANRILVSNGAGTVTTDATLVFDSTTKNLQIGVPVIKSSVYGIHQGNDGASIANILETYGTGVASFITGVRGRGTHLVATAVQADDLLLRIRGRAVDALNTIGNTSVEMLLVANEIHSPTAHGTRIEFWTTPNTTTTLTQAFTIDNAGGAQLVGRLTSAGHTISVNSATAFTVSDPVAATAPDFTVDTASLQPVITLGRTGPSASHNLIVKFRSRLGNIVSQLDMATSIWDFSVSIRHGGSSAIGSGAAIHIQSNGAKLWIGAETGSNLSNWTVYSGSRGFMGYFATSITSGSSGDILLQSSGTKGLAFISNNATFGTGTVNWGVTTAGVMFTNTPVTVTNAIVESARLMATVSTAATGGAAGFGASLGLYAETSTNLTNKQQGRLWSKWIVPTNGSETSAVGLDAYSNSVAQEFISGEAGATVKLAFYGGTRVVRGAALTAGLTTITHTAPGTPDYAIQDFVDVSLGAGWAFASHDEANSLLAAVANLQVRQAEIDARLNASTGVNLWA